MKKNNKEDHTDFYLKITVYFLSFFLLVSIIYSAVRIHSRFQEYFESLNTVTTKTVFLESIDYLSEVSGEFHLGCGDIKEKQYYVAYEVLEDEGKKLLKMPADITTIYDILDENSQACVEIDENGYGIVAIRLYVPKGTITRNYDLSLNE